MSDQMNGEKFLKRLDLHCNARPIEDALNHLSYLNEIGDKSKAEYNKGINGLGKNLCALMVAFNKYIRGDTEILSTSDGARLVEHFFKHYNMAELVHLGRGEIGLGHKYPEIAYGVIFELFKQIGFQRLNDLLKPFLLNLVEEIDYKTLLQEYVQSFKGNISYKVIKEVGPEHDKSFEVQIQALGKTAIAQGKSKKLASMCAAAKYVETFKIHLPQKQISNLDFIQLNKSWTASAERVIEFSEVLNRFKLDTKRIPYYYLDACFTHVSAMNEKRIHCYATNKLLSTLGSFILNFLIEDYLLHRFHETCNGKFENMVKLKAAAVSNEHISQYIPNNWLNILTTSKGQKNLGLSTVMAVEVIDSIIGALFIHAYRKNELNPLDSPAQFIQDIIIPSIETNVTELDYSTQLLQMNDVLKLDVSILKFWKEGSDHESVFHIILKCYDPEGKINNVIESGSGKNKKIARQEASKKIVKKLLDLLELHQQGNALFDDEAGLILLKNIVKKTINDGNHEFGKILGGGSLYSWPKQRFQEVILFLYKENLFIEVQNITRGWASNQNIEEINYLLEKEAYAFRELREIVESVLKKNNAEKLTDKIQNVFTRLYNFETECPFCRSDLINLPQYILAYDGEKYLYLHENVSICDECKVVGIQEPLKSSLAEEKLVISTTNVSPYMFQSTIIRKLLPLVITEDDETANNKEIIEETLTMKSSEAVHTDHAVDIDVSKTQNVVKKIFEEKLIMQPNKTVYAEHAVGIKISQKQRAIPINVNEGATKKHEIKKRQCSPERLEEILQRQKHVGYVGEKYVFEREKRVLSEIGRNDLAKNVIWISESDCAAGFDIMSYTFDGIPKYIEVKTTSGNGRNFEISLNEWNTASAFGERYYIYRVSNALNTPVLLVLKNPVQLADEEEIEVVPSAYRIVYKDSSFSDQIRVTPDVANSRMEIKRKSEELLYKIAEQRDWENSMKKRISAIDRKDWSG